MKKLQLRHVGLVLILGIVLILGYYGYRSLTVRQLSRDLHDLRQNINREQLAQLDLLEKEKQLSGDSDLADFVEELYAGAQRAGLQGHDVTTSQFKMNNRSGSSRRGKNYQDTGLKSGRLQVELIGSFREIAEYLKVVEASDSYKQIERFEMVPDGMMIKMTLVIALYQQQEGEGS